MPSANTLTMLEVHKLYLVAYEMCKRAQDHFRRDVSFIRYTDEVQFITIAGMDLALPDWASNVLYRLREEGFIDAPLDEYFELRQVTREIG